VSWTWFILGLIAVPLAAFALTLAMSQLSRVTPTEIASPADLQTLLRALLSAGNDRETMFVVWFPFELEIRVTKRVRRSRPPTLDLELRNSGSNRPYYAAAKAKLEAASIEFVELPTPTRKQPGRLRLDWPEGGPLVVSAVSNAIRVLSTALPSSPESRCAAACQAPHLWRAETTTAVQ